MILLEPNSLFNNPNQVPQYLILSQVSNPKSQKFLLSNRLPIKNNRTNRNFNLTWVVSLQTSRICMLCNKLRCSNKWWCNKCTWTRWMPTLVAWGDNKWCNSPWAPTINLWQTSISSIPINSSRCTANKCKLTNNLISKTSKTSTSNSNTSNLECKPNKSQQDLGMLTREEQAKLALHLIYLAERVKNTRIISSIKFKFELFY